MEDLLWAKSRISILVNDIIDYYTLELLDYWVHLRNVLWKLLLPLLFWKVLP